MTVLSKRKAKALEAKTIPNPEMGTTHTQKMSLYEKTREDRIKENLSRMQQLGLKDLALKVNSCDANHTKRGRRSKPSSVSLSSPLPPSGPTRRSSRLQNATPVSYSEVVLRKENGPGRRRKKSIRLEVGAKPEVYTEEHMMLLGNTERSWTLLVDGCGKDGKRIYDPINGKTCHQCRQKTLGYRTHCCQCQIVQGQFCGDCLYMRYGEHVLEARENPDWTCPACRGICNCSFCRQAKGWPPTGSLYRKVSSLGYKSVAHYLIQTLQSKDVEKSLVPVDHLSAKRSLSFPNTLCKVSILVSHEQIGPIRPQGEDKMDDDSEKEQHSDNQDPATDCWTNRSLPVSSSEAQSEIVEPICKESALVVWEQVGSKINDESNSGKKQQMTNKLNPLTDYQTKGSLPLSSDEGQSENRKSEEVNHEAKDNHCSSRINFKDKIDKMFKGEEESKLLSTDKMHNSNVALVNHNPHPASIAARLRSRHRKVDSCDAELTGLNEKISVGNASANQELENAKKTSIEDVKHEDDTAAFENGLKLNKKGRAAEPSQDSIGARLRQRRRIGTDGHDDVKLTGMNKESLAHNLLSDLDEDKAKERQAKDDKHAGPTVSLKITPKREKKAVAAEPSPDSIGGRLRQRRQMGTTMDK